MPATPVYALRYPALADAPNGPQGFQNLAEDVEAQIVSVDADLATLDTRLDTHDGYGRTVVARNRRTTNLVSNGSGSIYRVLSTIVSVTAGRTYHVWAQGECDTGVTPATSEPQLRYTTNNTEPTVTSTILAQQVIDHRLVGVPSLLHIDGLFICTASGTFRVALCHQRAIDAAGPVAIIASANRPCDLVVEDVGLTVSTTGTVY